MVIPEYTDPNGYYNSGTPVTETLAQAPALVTALQYAKAHGGSLNEEGYAHQYSNVANPYVRLFFLAGQFSRNLATRPCLASGRRRLMIPGMGYAIDYALSGPLSDLASVSTSALEGISGAPADVCRPVHALVIQPHDAKALGLPDERFAENQVRPAASLIGALLTLDPAPLGVARAADRRVIGTCRHFALLSCALLRYRGVAARVRCGFATYFQAGQGLDHWITEYWDEKDGRWVRIDSEILGQDILAEPADLRPGQFLSGGEAWTAFREGRIDAARFGVHGTGNWGPAEIRGNAVKDLAALNKVEMLPWDEWGRMDASYKGQTGADYDELIDTIARVCAADDPSAVADLYDLDELRVPPGLIA